MLTAPDDFLVFHVPLLRDIFSTGSLVCKLQCELQAELCMTGNAGSLRQGWTGAHSLCNKEPRDLWHQTGAGHWKAQQQMMMPQPSKISLTLGKKYSRSSFYITFPVIKVRLVETLVPYVFFFSSSFFTRQAVKMLAGDIPVHVSVSSQCCCVQCKKTHWCWKYHLFPTTYRK